MPERVHPRWPPDRGTGIHHVQARLAFGPKGGAYAARLTGVVDGTVLVERLPESPTTALIVARPDRLTSVLARDDLTMIRGAPLALVNEISGVLGIATGPRQLADQLRILSNVSRLEDGEAVEIPAVEDAQPSLQLLATSRAR
jgi:hypothetical protein